ncbi:hypothetical protein GCM10010182_79230 [Actinomadura cremea]|nr:hypothetical protein GCM10010182_79230 [Actinomadura cremea]
MIVYSLLACVGIRDYARRSARAVPPDVARLAELARAGRRPIGPAARRALAGAAGHWSRALEVLLRDLVAEGLAILIAGHDLEPVLGVCDIVHLLGGGRVAATGTSGHRRRASGPGDRAASPRAGHRSPVRPDASCSPSEYALSRPFAATSIELDGWSQPGGGLGPAAAALPLNGGGAAPPAGPRRAGGRFRPTAPNEPRPPPPVQDHQGFGRTGRIAMKRIIRICAAAALLAAAGCGTEQVSGPAGGASASATPEMSLEAMPLDKLADIANPGTGQADPRLVEALLPRFEGSVQDEHIPAAGVRLPVRDPKSRFISLRQTATASYSSPGDVCDRWTTGLWRALVTGFGRAPGAHLAVTTLDAPLPSIKERQEKMERLHKGQKVETPYRGLDFSEAIIAAPAPTLERLGDAHVPPACRRMTPMFRTPGAKTAAVEPIAVEPLGDGATAYRIVDAGGVTSHWVEIVRMPGHLIEIRIPNQSPEPPGDMTERLQRVARAAHERAAVRLR